MSEAVLEVDSVERYVNDSLTLFDIYLKCKIGDIIGIVGRNGSGKSLLMKIIFGIEKYDYKFVRINNKVYKKAYESGILKYLPQEPFLPNHLTVEKVISLYLGKENINDFIKNDEILERIIFHKISELSGGELRFLEINLLLKNKSQFVMLDEPFSFLSPKLRDKVALLIKEESTHKGIIISDHDFLNLSKITTKICLMTNGTLKHIKDRGELVFHQYLPR